MDSSRAVGSRLRLAGDKNGPQDPTGRAQDQQALSTVGTDLLRSELQRWRLCRRCTILEAVDQAPLLSFADAAGAVLDTQ